MVSELRNNRPTTEVHTIETDVATEAKESGPQFNTNSAKDEDPHKKHLVFHRSQPRRSQSSPKPTCRFIWRTERYGFQTKIQPVKFRVRKPRRRSKSSGDKARKTRRRSRRSRKVERRSDTLQPKRRRLIADAEVTDEKKTANPCAPCCRMFDARDEAFEPVIAFFYIKNRSLIYP